jgi:hypothetical protein
MTAERRTVLLFAWLWAGLAFYQFTRTAAVCVGADRSAVSLLLWAGQLALLSTPLVVIRRQREWPVQAQGNRDLALILLAYVPATLALRIAETCARH